MASESSSDPLGDVPFLQLETIHKEVEHFRSTYITSSTLPVDIAPIIEFDLGLEILPLPDLKTHNDMDALLAGDLTTIAVDQKMFMDDAYQGRMRFSLAHEVGHYVLHAELFESLNYSTLEEWIEAYNLISLPTYGRLEWQAHEFAGRLLVPPADLKRFFLESVTILGQSGFDFATSGLSDQALASMAAYIAPSFGVSDQVVYHRLKKENFVVERAHRSMRQNQKRAAVYDLSIELN